MSYKIITPNDAENNSSASRSRNAKSVSFVPIEPEWDLTGPDGVILSTQLREQLEDVIAFCRNKEQIIQDWELYRFMKGSGGCIGINFWGIPGTGKSCAAEAIAKSLGKKIIQASYSTLMDSLQGNTEKNITALFDTAVSEDCVILFDEADGLLSARKSGSSNSDSTNLIKSHLLNLLDRSNAIVIFTTNFFKSYDRAFVRRILWNIEFKTPNIEELTQLWKLHLGNNIPKSISYEDLATLTKKLADSQNIQVTGGDIRKLTLMFCTRLSANRISTIDEQNAEFVINKYLSDLQESGQPAKKEVTVSEADVPENVRNQLIK